VQYWQHNWITTGKAGQNAVKALQLHATEYKNAAASYSPTPLPGQYHSHIVTRRLSYNWDEQPPTASPKALTETSHLAATVWRGAANRKPLEQSPVARCMAACTYIDRAHEVGSSSTRQEGSLKESPAVFSTSPVHCFDLAPRCR